MPAEATAASQALDLQVRDFSEFQQAVARGCSAPTSGWDAPDQVRYLVDFLAARPSGQASSMLVEFPYVDRHYLEEYAAYYAGTLRPPVPRTTRIHVFRCAKEELSAALRSGLSGSVAHAEAEANLQKHYMGFVTIRPLPSAPIGRTALSYYTDNPERQFQASSAEHRVHIAGYELSVRALPFQQQEQGVAACATTALWAALSKVFRSDGGRAPTPFTLTAAATRYVVRERTLPALAGLEIEQILSAISAVGYSPALLKTPGPNTYAAFVISLVTYLRSGIPAILLLEDIKRRGFEYHAVVVSGFRETANLTDTESLVVSVLRHRAVSRLYVHDDQLGPYVRMGLEQSTQGDGDGEPILIRLTPSGQPDPAAPRMRIYRAVFALYPKLRLTAPELLEIAGIASHYFRRAAVDNRDDVRTEMRFVLGGSYLRELARLAVPDPERLSQFATSVLLSRYVGVIRIFRGEKAVADIVCDTTDIRRSTPPGAPILGAFAFHSGYLPVLSEFAAAEAPHARVV